MHVNNVDPSQIHQSISFSTVIFTTARGDIRHDLIAVLDGETYDFPWRILTGPLNEVTCSTFKHYVSWMIEKDSVTG